MKVKRSISKKQIQNHINELLTLARRVTSDVKSEVYIPGVEGQHAWLNVYVPDKLADKIHDMVVQRSHDIFMATGYDIGVVVHEKSQLRNPIAK